MYTDLPWLLANGSAMLDFLFWGALIYIVGCFGVTFYHLDRHVPDVTARPLKRVLCGHQLILILLLLCLMSCCSWRRIEALPPIAAWSIATAGIIAIASIANIGTRIKRFVLDPIQQHHHPHYASDTEEGSH